MRNTVIVTCIVIVVAAAVCLRPRWYMKNVAWNPGVAVTQRLTVLGDSALLSADVPVAALILYGDSVIGAGYNTVLREHNAGGHAEINAISAAIRREGMEEFRRLDRNRLLLVTTFEPCLMCEGAILEYDIRHVVVIKPKSLTHWYGQWWKQCRYEWNKQVAPSDTLQELLFRKHPLYGKMQ